MVFFSCLRWKLGSEWGGVLQVLELAEEADVAENDDSDRDEDERSFKHFNFNYCGNRNPYL